MKKMSDQNSEFTDAGVDRQTLKRLCVTKPHRHAIALLFNWFVISTTAALSSIEFNIFIYIIAVTIIGARMHALAVLMHDAAHFRFLKNRRWNDLLSNVLVMYPLLSSIGRYRKNHLQHHQSLNTEDDPDWVVKIDHKDFTFPKSKSEFMFTLVSYFFVIRGIFDALWFVKRFSHAEPKKTSLRQRAPSIIFAVTLLMVLAWTDGWSNYLLYWLVPFFSTFFMFQYVRSVAEHFGGLSYEGELKSTRTLKANGLERFFFAPHNIGYHLEHHLYPSVPFYHLPELHQVLLRSENYAKSAHITQGVLGGLLQELSRAQPPKVA